MGLAAAPDGYYVSSVITGIIEEYTTDGILIRTVLQPPDGETLGAEPFSTGTPLGLAVDAAGTLYYADIGIVDDPVDGLGPGSNAGSVRRIDFVDGEPAAPVTLADRLPFPDGLGVFEP